MTDAKPLFVDTNILVYANVAESPFHEQSLQAMQTARQQGRALWISRQVLREYLVTMTRPQTFPGLSKEMVLEQITLFSDTFHIADETVEVTQHLLQLVNKYDVGGKQVHDANVVATMLAHSITSIVTHNVSDFARFKERITIEKI